MLKIEKAIKSILTGDNFKNDKTTNQTIKLQQEG